MNKYQTNTPKLRTIAGIPNKGGYIIRLVESFETLPKFLSGAGVELSKVSQIQSFFVRI